MFQLYVYIECCLRRRYREKTDGQINRIDSALGAYFNQLDEASVGSIGHDESVRKTRLEMNRRLKMIDANIPGRVQIRRDS